MPSTPRDFNVRGNVRDQAAMGSRQGASIKMASWVKVKNAIVSVAHAIGARRPGKRLLQCVSVWLLLALLLMVFRGAYGDRLDDAMDIANLGWWLAGLVWLSLALIDGLFGSRAANLQVERSVADNIFLGSSSEVVLQITNTASAGQIVCVHDHCPQTLQAQGLPLTIHLQPNQTKKVHYTITPVVRGDAQFERVELRSVSAWRFWDVRQRYGGRQLVHVYPNFSGIAHIAALGIEHHAGLTGIHLQQQRGEGLDFRQLREFRVGDALRQIDWKASSRYHKPISREYQAERDQEIIFLLDCGRRMRAKDDELSHFDHALNAILVTAYVALRQGDAVGLGTFAGAQRWISPVKGHQSIHALMKHVYDVHSSLENHDLLQAATELMSRCHKRSLVVLVSSLREEDKDDALRAAQLLASRHLVMVANLHETFIDETLQSMPDDFQSALFYNAVHTFHSGAARLTEWLRANNVICLDEVPDKLHLAMVEQYLKLKRLGAI